MAPMTGRPTIDETTARVRGQATDGYRPPGWFPCEFGGSTQHIEDPYEGQDELDNEDD